MCQGARLSAGLPLPERKAQPLPSVCGKETRLRLGAGVLERRQPPRFGIVIGIPSATSQFRRWGRNRGDVASWFPAADVSVVLEGPLQPFHR